MAWHSLQPPFLNSVSPAFSSAARTSPLLNTPIAITDRNVIHVLIAYPPRCMHCVFQFKTTGPLVQGQPSTHCTPNRMCMCDYTHVVFSCNCITLIDAPAHVAILGVLAQ